MFKNMSNSNGSKITDLTPVFPGFYYFPDFLDRDESAQLLQDCYRYGRWVKLKDIRVQRIGGTVTDDGKPMFQMDLPKYIIPIKDRVEGRVENFLIYLIRKCEF